MNGSPSSGMPAVHLDVNYVEDAENEQLALQFKLTDECLEAVNNAVRRQVPITFSNKGNGMFLVIGSGANAQHFRVGSQPNPEGSSAVMYDEASHKYKCVAGINTKLQVQATDRSFTDTRVKAQKLLEEDKRKMTKDVQRYQRPVVRQLPGSRSNMPPPSFSKSRGTTETLSGPPKQPQPPANPAAPPVIRPTMSAHLRQELLRKPLRQRVLHLLATSKYPTVEDIVSKVLRDGVKEPSSDETPKIRQLVEELSEKNAKGDRLTLKGNFLSEVDMRWQWFSTEEKAHIRRTTASNTASSNFAPSRRSDIVRVQAPTASHNTPNQKDSPSKTNSVAPNPPKKLIPGNVNKSEKKSPVKGNSPKVAPPKVPSPKFAIPQVPSPAPSKSPEDKNGSLSAQPGVPKRRIANQSNHGAPPDKKTRGSPPVPPVEVVEPNERPKKEREPPKKKKETVESNGTRPEPSKPSARTSSSAPVPAPTSNGKLAASKKKEATARSKLLEARALFESAQPSKDWETVYGKIDNEEECEKYYVLFNQEHGEYMQAFHKVQSVITEFEDLGRTFRRNSPGSKEYQMADKQIRERFSHYVQDKDFLSNIQRNKDLKAKLGVLRERIADYHKAHGIDFPKVEMETGTGNGVKV
uniref:OCEL domain-containing protein n=1 Tax=Steinernema glaseri TaxID=37863 RepID=A0A1I7YKU5_9BILA